MQFQGLDNPVQFSPHHSHTPSEFVTEMMSMKPAKGKTLFIGASAGLRKPGSFV